MFFFATSPCFVRLIRKFIKGRKLQQGAEFSVTDLPMNDINSDCSSCLYQLIFALASDVNLELSINGMISSTESIFD